MAGRSERLRSLRRASPRYGRRRFGAESVRRPSPWCDDVSFESSKVSPKNPENVPRWRLTRRSVRASASLVGIETARPAYNTRRVYWKPILSEFAWCGQKGHPIATGEICRPCNVKSGNGRTFAISIRPRLPSGCRCARAPQVHRVSLIPPPSLRHAGAPGAGAATEDLSRSLGTSKLAPGGVSE